MSGSRKQLRFMGREHVVSSSKMCSYRDVDGSCGNLKVLLQKDGQLHESPFCKYHCCRRVTGQTPCHRLRYPQMHFCQEHLRCTSEAGGHRCPNWVKGMDPGIFRFCAAVHNCKAEGCGHESLSDGPAGLGFCEEHKCRETRCDRPAVQGSRRCAGHTCEAASCLAGVPGGDEGTADRFCERHRICGVAGCGRFTFTRDNGQACLHCGTHYCHAEGCDNARQGGGRGEHCVEHTCVEQGCHKGLERARSSYCKSHECKLDGCHFRRRSGGDWCIEHKCARPSCDGEAIADHYCERHMACSVAGCDQFRLPEGDGRCDEHSYPRCQRHRCTARAVDGGEWCMDHICRIRSCSGLGHATGGLCDRHRCSAQHCAEPRSTMRDGREWEDGHGRAYHDEDGPLAPFCRAHWCRWTGCMQQTAGDSRWCLAHARCEEVDGHEATKTGRDGGSGEERIRHRLLPRDRGRSCSHGHGQGHGHDRDHDHDHDIDCGRRPRYRECPSHHRHPTTYAAMVDEPLRPSRPRTGIWRRQYGRDMDDEWRWPMGI